MRRLLCALLGFALAACGSGAPQTGPSPLQNRTAAFLTGQYFVQVTGYDFSDNPLVPACAGPIGMPRAGKSVSVALNVARQGDEWVGRSTTPGVDLELRFRDAGEAPLGRRALVGTLRGQATDAGVPFAPLPPNGVSVAIGGNAAGGAAVLEGQTAFVTTATTLDARASGHIRFSDGAGNSNTCAAVSVWMNVPQFPQN